MSELHIHTELDNRAFVFGDTVRGTVEWSGVPDDAKRAELRLFYYTSGKGTRDIKVVDSAHFGKPPSGDRREFEFRLPAEGAPPSFSGRLVSLIWALELVIRVGRDELSEHVAITVSPSGAEIDLYAYADQNTPEKPSAKQKWMERNQNT